MGILTGFIVAGGKSSRMGTEKALLNVQGKTLIDHAIAQARFVAEDIFIVGPKATFSAYGRIVADIYTGCGPLGGVHAALSRANTELNLVLAVDTPFLTKKFLVHLAGEAEESGAMITIPRTSDGLQPLCGIYRKTFLPIAEAALKAGDYKLDALFPADSTNILDMNGKAMQDLGFNPAMFDNLNTREDYERVRRQKTQVPDQA